MDPSNFTDHVTFIGNKPVVSSYNLSRYINGGRNRMSKSIELALRDGKWKKYRDRRNGIDMGSIGWISL